MANMGFGPISDNTVFLRKYRWLFKLPQISVEPVGALLPNRSARPSVSFREIEAQHITETVFRPGKPEWKPLPLTLYDIKENSRKHPVWEWLRMLYDPQNEAKYSPSAEGFIKPEATLEMYDGKGNPCETWRFESVWCSNIEFGELEMGSSEVMTCDLTLRYDRAYLVTD